MGPYSTQMESQYMVKHSLLKMNPDFVWNLVMSGRVFTVVAENASLTLVYWKQTVLAEVASWNGVEEAMSNELI